MALVPIEGVTLLDALEDRISLEEARAALLESQEERDSFLGEDQEGVAALEGRVWMWPGTESNRRHEDFQSSALPTELPGQEFEILPKT